MSSSSNDNAPAADGGEGSHPQSGSASTARRVPADGRRDLQRRSSWEVADDYNRRIWLRQAGGDAALADKMRTEDEERIRRIVQG